MRYRAHNQGWKYALIHEVYSCMRMPDQVRIDMHASTENGELRFVEYGTQNIIRIPKREKRKKLASLHCYQDELQYV